jgi:metal-responsive CopG/Arc/MetJ family transcriptional regulator
MEISKPKETMVSFLMPTPILETIDDIGQFEERSRSSTIRRLVQTALKSYDFKSDDILVKQK